MQHPKLISIIIRTCQRPDILRIALDSIRSQTYRNIEVIVVEDGNSAAESLIAKEYTDLNVKYISTKKKVGRSRAGNIGLGAASGSYLNFLDDDDELFSEHIEILVNALEGRKEKVAYSVAEECQIAVTGRYPYSFKEKRKLVRFRQQFSRCLLYYQNFLPIQSILFSRELFEYLGGFDEDLEVMEDWDLWVRYSTFTDFHFVDRVTSRYYVAYERKRKKERDILFHQQARKLQEHFKEYQVVLSAGELGAEVTGIINDYTSHRVIRYMRRIVNYILYGEK